MLGYTLTGALAYWLARGETARRDPRAALFTGVLVGLIFASLVALRGAGE